MTLDPYKILRYALVTEKGTALAAENTYLFRVADDSTKPQIKRAVEAVYKVTVEKVNVVSVPRKRKRFRFRAAGYRPGYKKAMVTLKQGDKIAVA